MRRFLRTDAPAVLTKIKNGEPIWLSFGNKYLENRVLSNHSAKFIWPKIEKKPLNQHLLKFLLPMTDDHCSYCDNYPPERGDKTIDHFRPKSNPKFYSEVCQWENLYFACLHCQQAKGKTYSELLLRPDEISYSFHKYFVYDYINDYINPRPDNVELDQERANFTIDIFKLNHIGLRTNRRRAHIQYKNGFVSANECPYRFMLLD